MGRQGGGAMIRIMHASDLHVGDCEPVLLEALLDAVCALAPDVLVVTGDLTEAGRRRQFRALADWFARCPVPVVACPGNHDVPVFDLASRVMAPWRQYRALGLPDSWQAPGIAVQAFTSALGLQARLDWSQGRYGARFAEAVARLGPPEPGSWQLLACHHPPFSLAGARVRADTGQTAGVAQLMGDRAQTLLLCGHLHQARLVRLAGGARLVVAPSAASRRQRGGRPGFLLLEAGPAAALSVSVFRFEAGVFRPGGTVEEEQEITARAMA